MTVGDDDEVVLHCPLCGYSLRGLVDPRCPECGFAFAWAELREAARNRHPYLFEHGAGHNLRTFWLTFWRDCRPRRFWRELSPANPVRLRRLIIYWLVSSFGMGLLIPLLWVRPAIDLANSNIANRILYLAPPAPPLLFQNSFSAAQVDRMFPKPWTKAFVEELCRLPIAWPEPTAMAGMLALWSGLTLLTLLIFQASLRRKKIRNVHLVRCMVHSCNLPILFAAAFFAAASVQHGSNDLQTTCALGTCLIVITYRLHFAVKRYLRLDHALAMALASQIIVGLSVLMILLNVEGPWFH